MIRRLFALGCLALAVAACAPTTTETPALPTVAALPSATPTDVPTETPTLTLTNTSTPEPSATPTKKPTSTATRTPSITPPPSLTPTTVPSITATVPRVTETPNSTLIAVATQTAIILEAPTLATLTPVPAGSDAVVRPTSTGTPIVAAGVVITEPQFQTQLNEALVGTSIQTARVDFVPGGINLDVTAPGASALTSGRVFIAFTIFVGEQGLNNGLIIKPDTPDKFVMRDGTTPPEAFITAIYSELFPAVGGSFDTILNKRLGEDKHNLENITIDDTTMNILLLVPQP